MSTFSTGERVFLDTSFILNFLFGDERAVATLEKLIENGTKFYVNPTVIGEVKHGRYSTYGIREKVGDVKEVIKVADEFFNALPELEVVEITERTVKIARDLIESYNLLPNDAVILASCIQYGIKKLVTFDSDFKKLPNIKTLP